MKPHPWFDLGASKLHQLRPEIPADQYACPICSNLFDRKDLEADLLSREDVPPAAIGGHKLVLTCRKCNSTAGHDLDTALVNFEAVRRFARGIPFRPIEAVFDLDDVPLRGRINATDDGFVFTADLKRTNPTETGTLSDRPREGDVVAFKLGNPLKPRSAQLSLLRAGYLAAFAAFGYSYAWQPSLLPIRRAILGDDAKLVPPVLDSGQGADSDRSIFLIAEPDWLAEAVAVVIGQAIIVLPPIEGGTDPLAALAARRGIPHPIQGPITPRLDVGWPTSPQHAIDSITIKRLSRSA